MTPEQIQAKAEEEYPYTHYELDEVVEAQQEAFKWGASWAAGEMEKDVLGFAEWATTYYCDNYETLTWEQLYQIYKQNQ